MSSVWICVVSHTGMVCLASWPAGMYLAIRPSCIANILMLNLMPNVFNQFFPVSLPAIFINNNDRYHFIPLSVTLAGGHQVSGKFSLLASFSCTFQLIRMQSLLVFKQFKFEHHNFTFD